MPSVVLVVTQDKQGETIAQGSGFVYKQGLVATNLHVFKRASSAFVRLAGGGVNYKVTEVVGIDIKRDLCIIRIEDKTIAPLTLNSSKPAIGDEVFTFGNPKGLEGTVSKGIVSSIRSDLDLLQIDAAISPGSSGGPVINDRAEVIGIAVSSLTGGQNLNFAIPSAFLARMSDQQFYEQDPKGSLDVFDRMAKEVINSLNKLPVSGAGVVAVSDRENEYLKNGVKSYTAFYSNFEYDENRDQYHEEPRKILEKKLFDTYGNLVEQSDCKRPAVSAS